MSNTVYLNTTTERLDSNGDLLDSVEQQTSTTYTEYNIGSLTLATSASYTSVPFGGVTTAKCIRISSPTALDVKLNAGSQVIAGVTDFIVFGTFTDATVSQVVAATCEVSYSVFG